METTISYTDKTAYMSSDERKWIIKLRKLKATHPEEVSIIKEPEENDGCIYVKLPASWMKINPKRKVDMTEEQKDVLRERIRNARSCKS